MGPRVRAFDFILSLSTSFLSFYNLCEFHSSVRPNVLKNENFKYFNFIISPDTFNGCRLVDFILSSRRPQTHETPLDGRFPIFVHYGGEHDERSMMRSRVQNWQAMFNDSVMTISTFDKYSYYTRSFSALIFNIDQRLKNFFWKVISSCLRLRYQKITRFGSCSRLKKTLQLFCFVKSFHK